MEGNVVVVWAVGSALWLWHEGRESVNSLTPRRFERRFIKANWSWFSWLMAAVSVVKLPLDKRQWSVLTISQRWFRYWLGAIRQQAITWANVDQDLCRHMASLGHIELTHCGLATPCSDMDRVNIGSVNGLVPDGTKPLPEPVLTYDE